MAIACGGTGGHLFPGLAVADQLRQRGCAVTVLISPKEIDQQAVRNSAGLDVVTLPAAALTPGQPIKFLRGFWRSFRAARRHFRDHPPRAVLAMGGFTAAPPVLAGKQLRASAFLHESNSIPGRANRLLAPFVDEAFVYFAAAAQRLSGRAVKVTGMPVRPQFRPHDAASCRSILGLESKRLTVLIMGGSQGAAGINALMLRTLPLLSALRGNLQFIHLTGTAGVEKVQDAYNDQQMRALVRPFLTEMELALGAATLAVSRAGASSLAELAAMRVPAILIPYPHAADNHQFHNARAFEKCGAAGLLEQAGTTPESLARRLTELLANPIQREAMRRALAPWHTPNSAGEIADRILELIRSIDLKKRVLGENGQEQGNVPLTSSLSSSEGERVSGTAIS